MIFKRINALLKRIIDSERSPTKLAFTCALGIYIGIAPVVGLHTALVFLFGWIFAVSIPVLFTVSILIHNPWTMMPLYALDHFFGKWVFELLEIDYLQWDPAWVETCNVFLKEHTGITGLSLSAFLVGGNLLAIGISVMLYPVMKQIFTRYLAQSSFTKVSSFAGATADTSAGKEYKNVRILRQAQDERE